MATPHKDIREERLDEAVFAADLKRKIKIEEKGEEKRRQIIGLGITEITKKVGRTSCKAIS